MSSILSRWLIPRTGLPDSTCDPCASQVTTYLAKTWRGEAPTCKDDWPAKAFGVLQRNLHRCLALTTSTWHMLAICRSVLWEGFVPSLSGSGRQGLPDPSFQRQLRQGNMGQCLLGNSFRKEKMRDHEDGTPCGSSWDLVGSVCENGTMNPTAVQELVGFSASSFPAPLGFRFRLFRMPVLRRHLWRVFSFFFATNPKRPSGLHLSFPAVGRPVMSLSSYL